MTPCFGYMALWMILPRNLAKCALAQAALLRNTPNPDTFADIMDVIGDQGWQLQEGARIKAAYNFVSCPLATIGSDLACSIATIVNAPIMRLLYKLLQVESLIEIL